MERVERRFTSTSPGVKRFRATLIGRFFWSKSICKDVISQCYNLSIIIYRPSMKYGTNFFSAIPILNFFELKRYLLKLLSPKSKVKVLKLMKQTC